MVWDSKLQTRIALLMMESEYVSLSTDCKDLFIVMDVVKEIRTLFDLPIKDKSHFQVQLLQEDNVGALLLGQLKPCRMTP